MLKYESLAKYILQKKMLFDLLSSGYTSVNIEELTKIEEHITYLNNLGYVDRFK